MLTATSNLAFFCNLGLFTSGSWQRLLLLNAARPSKDALSDSLSRCSFIFIHLFESSGRFRAIFSFWHLWKCLLRAATFVETLRQKTQGTLQVTSVFTLANNPCLRK